MIPFVSVLAVCSHPLPHGLWGSIHQDPINHLPHMEVLDKLVQRQHGIRSPCLISSYIIIDVLAGCLYPSDLVSQATVTNKPSVSYEWVIKLDLYFAVFLPLMISIHSCLAEAGSHALFVDPGGRRVCLCSSIADKATEILSRGAHLLLRFSLEVTHTSSDSISFTRPRQGNT